jgi:hypothetical protein
VTRATDAIGRYRAARDLKRGDHVRLGDGRWALVLDAAVSKKLGHPQNSRPTVSAGLLVDLRTTEGREWPATEQVWSRSPAQQVQYMETVIVEARTAAQLARIAQDKVRAAGGAA